MTASPSSSPVDAAVLAARAAAPAGAARIGAPLATGAVAMARCHHLDPALCRTGCKVTGRGGALSVPGDRGPARPRSHDSAKALR